MCSNDACVVLHSAAPAPAADVALRFQDGILIGLPQATCCLHVLCVTGYVELGWDILCLGVGCQQTGLSSAPVGSRVDCVDAMA
jgi:hypothetical protein